MSTAGRLRREQAARSMRHAMAATPSALERDPPRADPPVSVSSLRRRARYAFDSSMSRGPSALIWYLGAAVVVVVLLFAGLILWAGAGPSHNPITAVYNVLLHTIDTGTQANDTGTTYELLDLCVTISGIFIFSAFIGVMSNSIDTRLQDLRKGRSAVLEHDHTLILGWSDAIFSVLSELVVANESRRRPCVVILADRDKVEMEDAIRSRVGDLRNTRIVCRTGDPMSADLALVAHAHARSAIVLSPGDDHPDATVIRTIMSLTRDDPESTIPIVAEITDPRNLQAARLAGGPRTVIVDRGLTVSRLIVQTSRQSGVALVYQDLLDFDGDEIYLREDAELTGRTFGEALLAYEDCALIGVRTAEGRTFLNPPMDTRLQSGDAVIAIAEDDSVLDAAQACRATVDEAAISLTALPAGRPEHTHVYGCNRRTPAVVSELDAYALPGSRVTVVALDPPDEVAFREAVGPLRNLTVELRREDTADRGVLERIGVGAVDRVVVMCDSEQLSHGQADARVLVTLLHLRDIARRDDAHFTIVSELLDEADRELARVADVDDVILSDQVSSYLLAQISEDRRLTEVFDELFGADGSEIYMRPADAYVAAGTAVTFATLVEAARRRGETAFGYRIAAAAGDAADGHGVRVNPTKSQRFAIAPGDRLIVLAES